MSWIEFRNEALKHVDINPRSGLVRGPGKFASEPLYVVAAYLMTTEGMQDEEVIEGEPPDSGTAYSVFEVDSDMAVAFPESLSEDDVGNKLVIWERSDGLVESEVLTPKKYEKFIEEVDAANEAWGAEEAEYANDEE